MSTTAKLRIGVDLGGTKISAIALGGDGAVIAKRREPTPRGDYEATIGLIVRLVEEIETETGATASVGLGMPGSLSPATGRLQNANSTWLNGKPLDRDLESALSRPMRLANDANCFALSEAIDGAAAGARTVFGVIIGTGCGGGIVIDGRPLDGPLGIGGEWGHNPLPWPQADEVPGPQCWCGRNGCMETWVSGPALAADHERHTGLSFSGEEIMTAAAGGDRQAGETLDRHADRLARGLAHVINIIDPDVIVLGGGLSNMAHLYEVLPGLVEPHIFADVPRVDIRPPRHGDDSGVRGAAWLWNE